MTTCHSDKKYLTMIQSNQEGENITLHPWNTEFTWENAIQRSGYLSVEQVNQYNEEGYIRVDNAFTQEELSTLTTQFDKLALETEGFLKSLENERLSIAESGAILFGIHPSLHFQESKHFVSGSPFTEIAHDLIGPNVRLYWDQIVYKQMEKPRRFPWHQDNGYGFVEPQQYLTCWVPLVDVNVNNGCPWIVPYVHKQGTLAHSYVEPLGYECFSDHPDAIPIEAQAGSIVVFSSLTPHMTGPNLTQKTRKAYIIQYAPEGSHLLKGDSGSGKVDSREPATEPQRQFEILVNGQSPL